MSRYIADQNKVLLLHESGTYATASGTGQWIGEVTENSITNEENLIVDQFLGNTSRSFGNLQQGPRNVNGTVTYNAQNMRLPFFAIGSIVDTSGPTNSTHIVSQIDTNVRQSAFTSGTLNTPYSFSLEDSKTAVGTGRNFVRTVRGCVPDVVTITAAQGEKVQVAVDYIGQTEIVSSGASTAVTVDTNNPYLWSSASLVVGGSTLQTVKEVALEIKNNIEAPHYLNGSRDISIPYPKNRDYKLSVTLDLNSTEADALYNSLYKSGASFNATFDLNQDVTAIGSQHAIFVMSGCKIISFENPSVVEGTTESTIEIRPQNVTATEYTRLASTSKFNPW